MRYILSLLALTFLTGCMSLQEKNDALFYAVESGNQIEAQAMLDSGADVSARAWTPRGASTALQVAASKGHPEIADILLARGSSVSVTDKYGDTPLHSAIKNNFPLATIKRMVENGADLTAKGELDNTPLHLATYRQRTDVIKLLRENGAEATTENRFGVKASDMAYVHEAEQLIKVTILQLNDTGGWIDDEAARPLFNQLKDLPAESVINALARCLLDEPDARDKVLTLTLKLNLPESELKLAPLLDRYGDKEFAKAYLNSGSPVLEGAGKKWAIGKGFTINTTVQPVRNRHGF